MRQPSVAPRAAKAHVVHLLSAESFQQMLLVLVDIQVSCTHRQMKRSANQHARVASEDDGRCKGLKSAIGLSPTIACLRQAEAWAYSHPSDGQLYAYVH